MTCPICGLQALGPGTTTFAADAEESVVVVRDVPADVCGNCGEAFISDEIAAELEAQVAEAKVFEPRKSPRTGADPGLQRTPDMRPPARMRCRNAN